MGIRRVALKPHAQKIRRWVDEGRSDVWISEELNTTPSSVQSFRSRNSIYRRDPVRRGGQVTEHPAVLSVENGALVIRSDATASEVFLRDWKGLISSGDLNIVVTPERIYVEKNSVTEV
ncbi:hypothetical protein [Rubrobacter indicoceani]|uniref:hypothetical protein n=1 Tax=Rubrobacter indicoceani TaxID=2051957 RepID=UPI0013C3F64F|nr:hypothetical protein [Rubrobacter indicoceani]